MPMHSTRAGVKIIGKLESLMLILLVILTKPSLSLILQVQELEKFCAAPRANFTIQPHLNVSRAQLDNTTIWPTWPTNSHSPVNPAHATNLHPLQVFLSAVIAKRISTGKYYYWSRFICSCCKCTKYILSLLSSFSFLLVLVRSFIVWYRIVKQQRVIKIMFKMPKWEKNVE